MGRAPCCDKANVKKGPWSPEEDAKLKEYIDKYGTGGNWIALPQKVGLRRCGKSCRLRWLNYLRPNIKHGEFSEEEDSIIINLFANIGSRWSIIAAQLPGRTDNDIKNYWNTKLKKKLMSIINPATQGLLLRNPHQPSTISSLLQHSSSPSSSSSSSSPSSLICGQAGSFTTTTTGFEQPITSFSSTTILNQESYLGQMPPHYQVNRESFQRLMFSNGGGEASCSSSDGSCNNNEQAFLQTNNFYHNNNNGVKQENQEAMMLSNGDNNNTITHVNGNGVWGSSEQAPLEYFGLEEIKQLISSSSSNTNNMTTANNNTSSCSNFIFDENKTTEERVLYYY